MQIFSIVILYNVTDNVVRHAYQYPHVHNLNENINFIFISEVPAAQILELINNVKDKTTPSPVEVLLMSWGNKALRKSKYLWPNH